MVIDNTQNGFTLYHLEGAAKGPIQTFLTDLPKMQVPKQVMFREECHIVVGGSDNGFVYIFEHKMGWLLEMLQHAKSRLVQTISVGTFMNVWNALLT